MAVNGYVRQSATEVQDGQVISGPPLADEFNALLAAFNNGTGHDHSGSVTGDGQQIPLDAGVSGILPLANGGLGVDATTTTITLNQPVVLTSDLTVNGTSIHQFFHALGVATLDSDLNVAGISTLHTTGITGNLIVTDATTTGTLHVTGGVTIDSPLIVNSNVGVGGVLVVDGTSTLIGAIACNGITSYSGGIVIQGASGNLTVHGQAQVDGTLNVGAITTAGDITSSAGTISGTVIIATGGSAILETQQRDNTAIVWGLYATGGVFRIWNSTVGDRLTVDSSGNLTLTSNFIHFGNTSGSVNTTGGPLIYADANNHVYKQGTGNGAFLFQNYAGTNVAQINSDGNIVSNIGGFYGSYVNSSGNIDVTAQLAANTVIANGITSNGNITADAQLAANTVIANGITSNGNITAAAGTVTAAQLTSTGEINAGGNLHAGAGLFLGNPYILTNGNPNLSQGPYITFDGTNYVSRLGAGNGGHYFQNSSGTNTCYILASGALHTDSTIDATGGINSAVSVTVGSGTYARLDNTGTYNQSGSWIVISARDQKNNIAPFSRGLDAILALNPMSYKYNSNVFGAAAADQIHYGLIADDVADVIPEMVGTMQFKGATTPTLSPGYLVYVLVNAVKELAARVTTLEGGKV